MRTARLFNCARCHKQVIICSYCDRGNIYCSAECSRTARILLVRIAGCRYQNTYKGRLNHAKRQANYRRHKSEELKKVTHHGSQDPVANDLLSPEPDIEQKKISGSRGSFCDFCNRGPFYYIRLNFLRDSRTEFIKYSLWRYGP